MGPTNPAPAVGGATVTAGKDLDRVERLRLVRAAEIRHGLAAKQRDWPAVGGLLPDPDPEKPPALFDAPAGLPGESGRRARRVARTGSGNSATFALLESFARAYCEPPMYVFRGAFLDVEASERLDHPLTRAGGLLRSPNPSAMLTMGALRSAIARAKLVAGNFYLVKARSGGGDVTRNTKGKVARLWPVWPTRMEPRRFGRGEPAASTGWIDYYAYHVGRGEPLRIPPANVIHFRNGMRQDDPRLGIGVVQELAEEVATDVEAALLVQAVLANLGIPGLVFSPEPGPAGTSAPGIDREDRAEIKASLMAKTTGRRRGEPIVLSRPTRLEQFHVDLAALNLGSVWEHVETRMSACLGWPAILAGLQAGLEAATYSNATSLRRFATENAAIPTWMDDAETWTLSLAEDFGLRPDEYIAYDIQQVRALREDQSERWERVGQAFGRNELTLEQHHRLLDLELPEDVDGRLRCADLQAGEAGRAPGERDGEGRRAERPSRPVPAVDGDAGGSEPAERTGGRAREDRREAWRKASGSWLARALDAEGGPDAEWVSGRHICEAVADFDRWARKSAPELVGLLSAGRAEGS